MAYITLKELKKILPEILDQWIDEDDESWEWIFQEIEQNCHVGKKKVKKTWKSYAEDYVSGFRSDIRDLNDWFKDLNKKVDNSQQDLTQLGLSIKDIQAEVRHMKNDISAAKSMAETAKQRTEVDYSKYSGKSDGKISYSKDCETCKYNGRDEHSPCISCKNNDKWEAKEIPIEKICMTCKFDCESGCIYSGDLCGINHEHWEARDNE